MMTELLTRLRFLILRVKPRERKSLIGCSQQLTFRASNGPLEVSQLSFPIGSNEYVSFHPGEGPRTSARLHGPERRVGRRRQNLESQEAIRMSAARSGHWPAPRRV